MQESRAYSDVIVFGHAAQTNRLFKTQMGESPNLEKLQQLVDIEEVAALNGKKVSYDLVVGCAAS